MGCGHFIAMIDAHHPLPTPANQYIHTHTRCVCFGMEAKLFSRNFKLSLRPRGLGDRLPHLHAILDVAARLVFQLPVPATRKAANDGEGTRVPAT